MSVGTKPCIYIEVHGGCVQAVYGTDPDTYVRLIDWDNADCDVDENARCKRLKLSLLKQQREGKVVGLL